jgi:glutathione synthase
MYGVVRALVQHPGVSAVEVASRARPQNKKFFQGSFQGEIQVIRGSKDFFFPRDKQFEEKEFTSHLDSYDAILLRLPRPIPQAFFAMLKTHFPENRIVNRPSGIEITSSKAFLLTFERFVVPMGLIQSPEDLISFKKQFPMVLKPLRDYGGRGLVKIEGDKASIDGKEVAWKDFFERYDKTPQPYLGMKFLKNVDKGDKRIVVAGGEILTASLRLPSEGSWLCNVAQGGTSQNSKPDQREREIVDYIDPILRKEGIFMYGLDTLVDDDGQRVISEVNTLSPGGIKASAGETESAVFNRLTRKLVDYLT